MSFEKKKFFSRSRYDSGWYASRKTWRTKGDLESDALTQTDRHSGEEVNEHSKFQEICFRIGSCNRLCGRSWSIESLDCPSWGMGPLGTQRRTEGVSRRIG